MKKYYMILRNEKNEVKVINLAIISMRAIPYVLNSREYKGFKIVDYKLAK